MNKGKLKICGTVILYNYQNDIVQNIHTYLEFVDKLYVIDNSKLDQSSKFNFNEKVKYITNRKNLGIAEALNIACKCAIGDGYKFILTMDQDSTFTQVNLENYLNCIKNESDSSEIAVYSLNSERKEKFKRNITKKREVKTAITSGSIINLDIYKKLNGFRDKLFIDEVDFDYCLKSNKCGYKVIRFANIYLNHNLGESEKIFLKIYHKTHPPLRIYYMTRNNLYIWKKYYKTFPMYILKVILLFIRKMLVILLFEKQKKEKFYYFKRGIKDFRNNKYGKFEK